MTKQPTHKENTIGKSNGPHPRKRRRLEFPPVLGKPLPPFAAQEGASPFAVAQTYATPKQVHRGHEITGPTSPETYAEYYRVTKNPIWLWMSLSLSRSPEEMPPEVFDYLRRAATEVFAAVVKQVESLDVVRIDEGEEAEEGIVRQSQRAPASPDISQVLGLSNPGRNPFQSAAKDMRAVSVAVAVMDLRRRGYGGDQIYAALATINGRVSSDTGPSVTLIKQMVTRGRKLIAANSAKKPR